MKLSAIDIGSNSVRLLVWADGRSLYKKINTTRLGEGLAQSGELSEAAMRRGERSRQRERPLRTAGPAYFQNLST